MRLINITFLEVTVRGRFCYWGKFNTLKGGNHILPNIGNLTISFQTLQF